MIGAPFRVIFFDCDSTLSAIEGIDELARSAGVADSVAELTRQAMEGGVSLESVYRRRLELVRPSRAQVQALGELYVARLVPGAPEVVEALQRMGKDVHLVSGGVLQALRPLADALGVAADHLHAVRLDFDEAGNHAGFDERSPLARSGGKAEACRRVLAGSPGPAAFVGDGVTDLEARPPCDVIIGFGGVASRDAVRAGADAWVPGPSLAGVLEHLLTDDERTSLRAGRA